jgi:K+-transporting ATPase ATPase C chain
MLLDALRLTLVLTLVTGIAYPLLVTGLAQVAFPRRANGSLKVENGRVAGSDLIGQPFVDARYFHGRPSETPGGPYHAAASGASNLAPSNPELVRRVARRIAALRAEPGVPPPPARVPVDLVTASGSGLDPDLSVAGALLQVPRVARARGLPEDVVRALVVRHAPRGPVALLAEPVVNVLDLNLALDRLAAARGPASPGGPR